MPIDDAATTVGIAGRRRAFAIGVVPLLGLAIGLGLPPFTAWLDSRPDEPARQIIDAADAVAPWLRVFVPVVAVGIGCWVAILIPRRTLRVSVADDELTLDRGATTTAYSRTRIEAVFIDVDRLVLLDPATRELARERFEGDRAELAEAFREHRYPWNDADPYLAEYQRWIADSPGLDPGTDAVFRVRARALGADAYQLAEELRAELAERGFVVRDEGNRQYWRRTP